MEFREVLRKRRMIRSYDPERIIPPQMIQLLLTHAVRAPSAGFSQGWDFLVLSTPHHRQAFWDAATGSTASQPDRWLRGMMTAPLLVLCLSNKNAYLTRYAKPDKGSTNRDEDSWDIPYWDVDTGMAALLMLLTAVDAGLEGCFFGVPSTGHERLRATFAIPPDRRFVGVVSIGYPAKTESAALTNPSARFRPARRSLHEIAHDGQFGIPYPSVVVPNVSELIHDIDAVDEADERATADETVT